MRTHHFHVAGAMEARTFPKCVAVIPKVMSFPLAAFNLTQLLTPLPTTMAAASTKLANTYELVEQILLDMDPKTLLLAQRVSKTWRVQSFNSRNHSNKLSSSHSSLWERDHSRLSAMMVSLCALVLFLHGCIVLTGHLGPWRIGRDVLMMPDGYILRNQSIFRNPFV